MRFWGSLILPGLASAAGIITLKGASNSTLEKCPGYTASNIQTADSGLTAELTLAGSACNVYGDDLKELILQVTYETDNRLHVKIQDAGNQVYQVPESVFARSSAKTSASASHLQFAHTASPFSFNVTRRDTSEVLFDTSAASLVFESQYLRLRTALPSDPYLYGLGEHSDPFRLNTTAYVRTLWNQDSFGIPNGANLYGAHPFYLEQRATGAHGVLFLNSNGMDIMIDQDASSGQQYLEYNTLGGVLDFYFFAGPSPVEVSQQYGALAGTPAMQPYWGLGFHNCRYGYQDAFDVAEVVYNYSAAGIPLETMWTDIDYMDRRRVFSLDPQRYPLDTMRALVSQLHERDQHYVVMVDPAVAYQDYPPLHRGIEQNAFLLRANGSAWIGVVWPGVTVFPDWFAETADGYWTNEFKLFFDRDAGLDIDALWIDMNEPSNFPCNFPCDDPYAAAKGYPPPAPAVRAPPRSLPGWPCQFQVGGCAGKRSIEGAAVGSVFETINPNVPPAVDTDSLILPARAAAAASGDQKGLPDRDLLYPKYAIHNKAAYRDDWNAEHGGISNHTVNTDVMHQNGLAMYDTHNMYGSLMSIASREAMLSRRPGLRPLIITRSTFAGAGAKVGHWLGDNLSTWQKYRESVRGLLAFSALFQFGMVGSDVCGFAGNTTEELCARWAALGAFSSFYRNHNEYGAIGQEFYRWPSVAEAAKKAIDIRYRLMDYFYTAMHRASVDGTPSITPVFFHYPDDRATWPLELQYFYGPGVMVAPVADEGATSVSVYLPRDNFYDWYTHRVIHGGGRTHTFTDVDVTTIPLLIRAGVVIPLRARSANTTTELRKHDFELLVPLDEHGTAAGELYVDDGVSVEQPKGGVTDVTFAYEDGVLRVNGTFATGDLPRITKVTVLGEGCKTRRAKAAAKGAEEEEEDGKRSRSVKVDISLNEASSTKI